MLPQLQLYFAILRPWPVAYTFMVVKHSIENRLKPLFIGVFLQSFVLWYAIATPFLAKIGLNKEHITLIFIIFSSVLLLTNIPFGILSDRWSRKGVLIIASLSLMGGTLLAGNSNSFEVYALAMCLDAIFFACSFGIYDSAIYDLVLEEDGNDHRYEHFFGRLNLIRGLGLGISSLLGGVGAHFVSLRFDYYITVPIVLCSALALLNFREPTLHRKTVVDALQVHLSSTFKAVLQKGVVLRIVIALVLFEVGVNIMSQLDQLWMIALSLPIIFYGPVNAALLIGSGSSGLFADKLKNSRTKIAAVVGGIFVFSLLLLTRHIIAVVVAQVLFLGGFGILNIVFNKYLHAATSSKVRSGVSSIVSTVGTLVFLPLAYLFGYISDHQSVFKAAWIAVSIAALACIAVWSVLRRKDDDLRSEYR